MPRPLQVRHGHHGQEMAHVETVGGGIKPVIEGDGLLPEQPLQSLPVRALLDEPPLTQDLKCVSHLDLPNVSYPDGRVVPPAVAGAAPPRSVLRQAQSLLLCGPARSDGPPSALRSLFPDCRACGGGRRRPPTGPSKQ